VGVNFRAARGARRVAVGEGLSRARREKVGEWADVAVGLTSVGTSSWPRVDPNEALEVADGEDTNEGEALRCGEVNGGEVEVNLWGEVRDLWGGNEVDLVEDGVVEEEGGKDAEGDKEEENGKEDRVDKVGEGELGRDEREDWEEGGDSMGWSERCGSGDVQRTESKTVPK